MTALPFRMVVVPALVAAMLFPAVVLSFPAPQSSFKAQGSAYAVLGRVPSKASAKQNPLSSAPDNIAAGRKLFEEHCAECHGIAATGGRKGPNLRAPQVQQATPGALFWILSNGVVRHGMPDWSKLPDPERWQIISFLNSLKKTG
jgi:mono/diheme cytochrome c family protein